MKITFKKERGILIPYLDEDLEKLNKIADGAIYEIDIKNMDIRTIKQNKSLHLYFTMLSNAFNEQGQTVPKVLKIETKWTPTTVKELLWKPIQEAVVSKKSTAKLNKDEINKVYEVLNMALGQKMGIHIPFPSNEV